MSKELLRLPNGAKMIEYHVEAGPAKIVLHCQFDQIVLPEDLVLPALVEPIERILKKAITDAGWGAVGMFTFNLSSSAFDDFKGWTLTATPLES